MYKFALLFLTFLPVSAIAQTNNSSNELNITTLSGNSLSSVKCGSAYCTNNSSIQVCGTSIYKGYPVEIQLTGYSTTKTITSVSGGEWCYTTPSLVDGTYTFTPTIRVGSASYSDQIVIKKSNNSVLPSTGLNTYYILVFVLGFAVGYTFSKKVY